MKTNVIMVREMGSFKVSQRTKDGMFNATLLLSQWNKSKGLFNRKGKRIDDFLNINSTKEFLKALEEEIYNTEDSRYLKTHQSTRGKNGGTWMHPYLFLDFAMWINPKFKLQVIKFVHDQLIDFRHASADNYKILSSSGVRLKGYDFIKVAKALQWIVFDKTGKGLRNTAKQSELEELTQIQTKLAFAIDMGYIKSFQQLESEMRRLYRIKYNNKLSA